MTTMVAAQDKQFTIASLNVDGLPQKVLFLDINADGPGKEGSLRIGKYLAEKSYDMVFMQEDFNFHTELALPMACQYNFDKWSGSVGLLSKKIDFLHLQNLRFDCDGLGAAWKGCIKARCTDREAWNDVFGKFSHANDELATKGFRRYEATLPSGLELVVYNVHMDAGDDYDEKNGNDYGDRLARLGEWQQLLDHILPRIDERPIIILGDMNSYYCRDQIEASFIDAINATGMAEAHDAWIELEKDGQYPEPIEGIVYSEQQGFNHGGETLDKIIYINPADGPKLTPVRYTCDKEDYQHEGKALGDHYPIAATFEVSNLERFIGNFSSGVSNIAAEAEQSSTLYDLSGRKMNSQTAKGLYIERKGNNTRKRIIK